MGIVIAKDMKSEAGIEYHTPSSPQNSGNTYAMGSRNISCLDNERKMEILTLPIHWKKLVITA
jgi:hypothetical protein